MYGSLSILLLISISHWTSSVVHNSYECTNPNYKLGVCISLYACPTVLKLFLNSPGSREDETFLENSYCAHGFGAAPYVCCSNENSFLNESHIIQPQTIGTSGTKNSLPATREECAQDAYLSLAAWELTYTKVKCIGALINNRYILTSAWCASNARNEIIRIGNSNRKDVRVELRIAHDKYTHSDDFQFDHDIGLMRLSSNIQFNNEIAPICLPSVVSGVKNYKIGDAVQFPVRSEYNVNLKIGGKIVERCKDGNKASATQLCVGGDVSNYYWSFEYGAPIVVKHNGAWVVDAVYGFHRTESFAILARVSDYENWILSKLEP